MDEMHREIAEFLQSVHPYDTLSPAARGEVAAEMRQLELARGAAIYRIGDAAEGIYLIRRGSVEITDGNGALVSILSVRNSFGERGLMRNGRAATTARAATGVVVLLLPARNFHALIDRFPAFHKFFSRGRPAVPREADVTQMRVADLLARAPLSCGPDVAVAEAARQMRDAQVSSLGVTGAGGQLLGLITQRDMSNRVLAEGLSPATPVAEVMTRDPHVLPPEALGADVVRVMLERRVGHLPVVRAGQFLGMVTQTDLTRLQSVNSMLLVRDAVMAGSVAEMAAVTARIPGLLAQLVGGNRSHEVTTRLITDIADAVTRRLIVLAEATLGPAPVAYVWAACGSQGRQEQTGVSDQDNCLIHADPEPGQEETVRAYFAALAETVCAGLDACGYVFCPGDMMARNPRWCQPVSVWRGYFRGWVATPDPMAQMLASVMFDLRPVAGAAELHAQLQREVLEAASQNSIFVAHMIANSLKHAPPLSLLRGFATIRSGEHRNQVDMKLNGVVPVVDLGRVYALKGQLGPVNTRARLVAAQAAGLVSGPGGRELTEAYDLIASMRLERQAALVRAGRKPDNFLAPSDLSDFERSHLRDAFVVVRSMQSALGHGKGALT